MGALGAADGGGGGTLGTGDSRGGGGAGSAGGCSRGGCTGEGGLSGDGGGGGSGGSIGASSIAQLPPAVTQACATSCARWTGLDAPVGQSSKRQLASATSRVLVLVRGSPPWCIICSWWQPSGRLRLAVVLLSPGERVKLASDAGPLISGLTTSCRPSHPSPKLSNSCTRTRAASCSSGGATGGGGGSTGNGGRPTGGAEGSTECGSVEGGGAEG